MASEEWVPLPAQAVKPKESGMESDDPRMDAFIGEQVLIKAFEWIGDMEKPKGVRFYLHIVKGEQMEKDVRRVRAYTESILRLCRGWSVNSLERGVRLEKWPIYEVVRQGASYGLRDV